MDWLTLRTASEALAARAHEALRAGIGKEAEALFQQAAAAEEEALSNLDPSRPRTLGVTAVSAVSLWYKGKDLQRASRATCPCRHFRPRQLQ